MYFIVAGDLEAFEIYKQHDLFKGVLQVLRFNSHGCTRQDLHWSMCQKSEDTLSAWPHFDIEKHLHLLPAPMQEYMIEELL